VSVGRIANPDTLVRKHRHIWSLRLTPQYAYLSAYPGHVEPHLATVAEAEVAYIGDPSRFTRHTQVGAYVGLVPSQDSSGGVNRLGHVTKDGPATLRGLLTEGAWQAKRRKRRATVTPQSGGERYEESP
jgi:transposase